MKEEFEKIKSTLYTVMPFVASMLSRLRVISTRRVPTAGVNENDILAINPDFWKQLDIRDKAWVLAHEVMHVAFRDLHRLGERNRIVWNIACDAVNNTILNEFLASTTMKYFGYTLENLYSIFKPSISYESFLKLHKEEVYKYLNDHTITIVIDLGFERSGSGSNSGDISENHGDKIIQEGDPNIYKDRNKESREEKWKEAVASSYNLQKTIGNTPLGLTRLVNKLLNPAVSWRNILRQALNTGIAKTAVNTWKRPSRKHDDLPGLRKYSIPTVWCLIDTSGSIDDKTLTQFLTEVYSISSNATVKVIPWDAKAYEIITAKNKRDVINNIARMMKGGGGTVIRPVLKIVDDKMKHNDIVIIFSDFDIYDFDEDRTKDLLISLSSKASTAIFCSEKKDVKVPGWRTIILN